MSTSRQGPAGRRPGRELAPPVEGLADRAAATYLTMEFCRGLADEETTARLAAAMGSLDDVARWGHLLTDDDRRRFLDDLREIDEMLTVIREHLREGHAPD